MALAHVGLKTGLTYAMSGEAFSRSFANRLCARTKLPKKDLLPLLRELNAAARRELPIWSFMVPIVGIAVGLFTATVGVAFLVAGDNALSYSTSLKVLLAGVFVSCSCIAALIHAHARTPRMVARIRESIGDLRERLRAWDLDWELMERDEYAKRYPAPNGRKSPNTEGYVLLVRRLQSSKCGSGWVTSEGSTTGSSVPGGMTQCTLPASAEAAVRHSASKVARARRTREAMLSMATVV
eukprot:TRINITY_DN123820_c0_g1_i1.p1 TRINITY_DN123820_c0_g1~~TRINITY_DN123820_c0_g1_i1.p1  ORF type:complete len:239 (-),score=19.37 TRINITY_DN123820_c0_g1_i1:126-842(-)